MSTKRQKTGALLLTWLAAARGAQPALAPANPSIVAIAESFALSALTQSPFPIRVHASGVDGRLTLADCAQRPAVSLPVGAKWSPRTLVQLRCTVGPHWTVLLPVDIESQVPVLILKVSASRDARLAAGDVRQESRWVPGLPGDYVNALSDLSKQHLRRPLGAGTVLTASDLERDAVIKRGQLVTVLAESAGMRIQGEAIALADARIGERLRLQNRGSLKLIEGMVDEEGIVRVDP